MSTCVSLLGTCVFAGLIVGLAQPVGAQLVVPDFYERSAKTPARPRTAAELDEEIRWTEGRRSDEPARYADSAYIDSLRQSARRDAQRLISSYHTADIVGRDADAAARLAVRGGDTALAHRLFDARIRTPGVSLIDKATTYLVAVRAFSNRERPEQLPSVERYVASLDALGTAPEIALWQLYAHYETSALYQALARNDDALRHADAALAVLPRLPFEWWFRAGMYLNPSVWHIFAEQPNGPARIAAAKKLLLARCEITPEIRSQSASVARIVNHCKEGITGAFRPIEFIGQPAPLIIGNYWINAEGVSLQPGDTTIMPNARTLNVRDGRVHLFATLSGVNAPGHDALRFLVRVQEQYGRPDSKRAAPVQVNAVVWPTGWWGYRQVTGDVELDRLRPIFRDSLHITFPMSATVGPRVPAGQGTTELPGDPNGGAWCFPPFSGMAFWIVDATGRVRKIYGTMELTPDLQDRIIRALNTISAERRH